MKNKFLVKINNDNESSIQYLGYYEMLNKISKLIDKVSIEDKFKLIDKYIEILKYCGGKQ